MGGTSKVGTPLSLPKANHMIDLALGHCSREADLGLKAVTAHKQGKSWLSPVLGPGQFHTRRGQAGALAKRFSRKILGPFSLPETVPSP